MAILNRPHQRSSFYLWVSPFNQRTKEAIKMWSKGARTVLKATVKIDEKSVSGVIDAVSRINILLGTYTLHSWGNGASGWWSWITHGSMAGLGTTLAHPEMEASIKAILELPMEVRKKMEAALFWISEPRPLMLHSYRPSVLRVYSSYWNALECLVEAVHILKPRAGLSKAEKQAQIEQFFSERGVSAESVQECYHGIIDTGFRGKATHAFRVCFGDRQGQRYSCECFTLSDKTNRLYEVRNSINHGSVDADNPIELIRVQARLGRLWMIVWRMFGCFVPFPAPAEPPTEDV
jgi:hypothetical protein